MTKSGVLFAATLVLSATVMTGCMPKMTIEEMKAMTPERPAELDRLNFLIGTWEGTGEVAFGWLDCPLKITSRSTIGWELDNMVLVEHAEFSMEELGDMKGVSTWTYDAGSGKYRTFWIDSMGGSSTGTARYREKTNTWHFKAKINSAHGTMSGKGTMKMVDDDTMEWTWNESALMGMMKISAFSGTMQRVK